MLEGQRPLFWGSAILRSAIPRVRHSGGPPFLPLTLQEARLSPRERATRRVSWTVRNVVQMFIELHLINLATGQWPSRSPEVIGDGTIAYDTSCYLCVVTTCVSCTISLILPHLRCTWLPLWGVTLNSFFIFGKQLQLKTTDTFPFMYTHSVVNMCHIIDEWELERFKNSWLYNLTFAVVSSWDFLHYLHNNVFWHCDRSLQKLLILCQKTRTARQSLYVGHPVVWPQP